MAGSKHSSRLSKDESFFVAAWRWIKGYGTPVAGAGSALLIGLSTHPSFVKNADWMVPTGIVLGILSIIGVFAVHPSYPRLTEQRDEARAVATARANAMRGTLRVVLKRLMREIGLTNTHYRVSIYCHSDASFLMLARHSGHQRWARDGRVRYHEADDVITSAWAEGWSVFIDLPEDKQKRVDELVRRQGMDRQDAMNLTMPSRSVVGYRLVHDGDPVGVLVLESTQARGVGHSTKNLLEKSETVALSAAIMASAPDRLEATVDVPVPDGWLKRLAADQKARHARSQAAKTAGAAT